MSVSSSSSSNKPTFSISSDPLFSTLLSFSALILLNFPPLLWRILLSPAVLLTGFLFLSLLRLGATQKSTQRQTRNRNNRSQFAVESESSAAVSCLGETQGSILRQIQNRKNRSQIAVQIDSKQPEISSAAVSAAVSRSEVADSCACLDATPRSMLRQIKNRANRSQIVVEIDSKQSESSAAVSEAITEASEVAISLSAKQRSIQRQAVEIDSKQSEISSAAASEAVSDGSDGGACFDDKSFMQWNVRAPLEVIHEEYENESDEPEPRLERVGLDRYPSLAMYYPETDSDGSSDGGWPESMDENMCFMWDEDEDRDEMIEISLETMNKNISEFQLELEDSLIEIDISPTRNAGEFADEC